MGITGTPVYEACNNTIQTLQSRYNELDKQLEKLRKDADRITEKIFEIRREYKDLNQAEVNEILSYVRSYAAMLSSREIDILLCHCQNKLNGNIDSVFLTLENPKKQGDKND
ncbi:MAG: hypothetical protein MSA98_10535 [Spirochaetia bacterium]|nr:hypothetical protein [Spirochaetia bacterium]